MSTDELQTIWHYFLCKVIRGENAVRQWNVEASIAGRICQEMFDFSKSPVEDGRAQMSHQLRSVDRWLHTKPRSCNGPNRQRQKCFVERGRSVSTSKGKQLQCLFYVNNLCKFPLTELAVRTVAADTLIRSPLN